MKSHPNVYKLRRIYKTAELLMIMITLKPELAKKYHQIVKELEEVILKHEASASFYRQKNLLKED